MDIRVEKTESAIKAAFVELRARKPVEKIKVKELCDAAHINKSTFYAHYQDIYALSEAMENELVHRTLSHLSHIRAIDLKERPDWITRELFRAFDENKEMVGILFSGTRKGLFVDRVESCMRELIDREDPDYWKDPVRCIVLSFCVQGAYYSFRNNSGQMDEKRLVAVLGAIAKAAQNISPTAAE